MLFSISAILLFISFYNAFRSISHCSYLITPTEVLKTVSIVRWSDLCSVPYITHLNITSFNSVEASIRSIVVLLPLSSYVFMPRGSRLFSAISFIKSIIASASPCLATDTSSPPYNWSYLLKSPTITIFTTISTARLTSWITLYSMLYMVRSACGSSLGTYTDATTTCRSGSRTTATVISGDCTNIYSTSTSLLTQSMLRIAHLPSFQIDGIILIHL